MFCSVLGQTKCSTQCSSDVLSTEQFAMDVSGEHWERLEDQTQKRAFPHAN